MFYPFPTLETAFHSALQNSRLQEKRFHIRICTCPGDRPLHFNVAPGSSEAHAAWFARQMNPVLTTVVQITNEVYGNRIAG